MDTQNTEKHIRQFESSDYLALIDIYAHSKLDELKYERQKFTLLPLNQDQKRLTELQQSDVYVYDNQGVIAYGAIHKSEIRALFVHSNSRKKGIGRALFQFLLSKLTYTKDNTTASLFVAKSNRPAKLLYESYGFKVVDEFESEYNGVTVFANKMEKEMTADDTQL